MPCRAYGVRVPASRVPYVPEAGQLAPWGHYCTCTTRGLASGVPHVRTYRVTTGNLRLNHLRIKPDALSALQLPVVLKHGYVGSLHIVIPFAGLKSTPVQVNLENVFIVARLVRKFDGQEHVKGRRKATDQAILGANVAEEASRVLEAEHAREASPYPFAKAEAAEEECTHEAADTWKDQLIATIKDNIQINVTKVHVRLEDDFIDHLPFCVGLTLGTLAVCTCDRQWQPLRKNVTRNEEGSVTSTNRRLAQVQSLAIYWDCVKPGADWQVGLGDEISVLAFKDMIEEASRVEVGHCQSKRHDFVLAPASVEAKMTQRKPKEAVDSRQPELEVHQTLTPTPNPNPNPNPSRGEPNPNPNP